MNIKNHIIFIFLAIVSFVISVFNSTQSLDIANHDTYFIIQNNHIFFLTGIYFLLCSLLYFWIFKFKRKKIKILLLIHSLISFIGFIVILYFSFFETKEKPLRRYYDYSVYEEFDSQSINVTYDFSIIWTIFSIVILISILVFIANMVLGFLKKDEE